MDDEEYERAIFAELGLPLHTPFVLFNVEPTYEHNYATWDEHWSTFRRLMTCMQRVPEPVVLSLHPLCNREHYAFVEDEFSHKIAERRSQSSIRTGPLRQYPSSTNPLASVFDVPLVMYDFLEMTKPEAVGPNAGSSPACRSPTPSRSSQTHSQPPSAAEPAAALGAAGNGRPT